MSKTYKEKEKEERIKKEKFFNKLQTEFLSDLDQETIDLINNNKNNESFNILKREKSISSSLNINKNLIDNYS